ncbi:hypothetical protein [Streptomyces sp. NBC_00503]|uniref:hypothetical protein n=1 Tax=Streptomyces sp. NBC_00503 TaxID=2903659 RepID=UPI002E81837C|nr:hypothetical protein [Streptomyces sp. NBC_00503]WUD86448.1 hypothetical protein OG490_38215 [Streptomyces sp. NBC_00503]
MTDASVPSPGTPHQVLADLGELTRKVRTAQRGTWFPLLLFGVLTLGGILVDRLTSTVLTVTTCPPMPGSTGTVPESCTVTRQGSPLYWILGITLAYALTAFFYVRRSRNRGVGTPVRPYVLAGIALVALVAATSFWVVRHGMPLPGAPLDFWGLRLDPAARPTQILERFVAEPATIGLPLLVLSWVERSRALLLFTLAYLAIELAPVSTGSPWSDLPRLAVPAAFLLLGSLGFALAQRPRQRGAS